MVFKWDSLHHSFFAKRAMGIEVAQMPRFVRIMVGTVSDYEPAWNQ